MAKTSMAVMNGQSTLIVKLDKETNMVTIDGKILREIRCPQCKAFVAYDHDLLGTMVKQCPKCGISNTYTFKQLRTSSNLAKINTYLIEKLKGGE